MLRQQPHHVGEAAASRRLYYTGMIGKWHLASDPKARSLDGSPRQGAYFDPVFYLATGEKISVEGYVTDIIKDIGIEFSARVRGTSPSSYAP